MALFTALWCFSVSADPGVRRCGFHWLTGRPCPLCGLTRSLFALAKGHWGEAVHFNALSPLAFVMLFALFWNGRTREWMWRGGAAAFAVYGLWRGFFPAPLWLGTTPKSGSICSQMRDKISRGFMIGNGMCAWLSPTCKWQRGTLRGSCKVAGFR